MNKKIYLHQQSKLIPFIPDHKTYDSHSLKYLNTDGCMMIVPMGGYVEHEERMAMIKYAQQSDSHIYIEDCVEGSSTFIRHLDQYGLLKRALNKDISIIASGEMPEQMSAVSINYMMYMTGQANENHREISIAKENKPYTFLFLNNRVRKHRSDLIQHIQDMGYLDQALWSNKRMDASGELAFSSLILNDLPEQYDPQESKDLIDWNTWSAGPVIKPQYQDTYFSVFAESAAMHRYAFPTEKTWKPIIAGHPFIALSNSRHYTYLRELGFQTFNGIIDETWAGMTRWPDAVRWMVKEIGKLLKSDLDQFVHECNEITTHNKKQFWALYDSYITDTQSKLNQLFEQVE